MNDGEQTKSSKIVPLIITVAFLVGAVLYGLWMFNAIQRTREARPDSPLPSKESK